MGYKEPDYENFIKLAAAFFDDRVLYAYKVLNFERLDPKQIELLQLLDKYDHIAAKAGHGTGKTTGLAICVHHHLSTRAHCRVPCTAPSKHQLQDVLWAELSTQIAMMKRSEIGRIFAANLDYKKETICNLLSPDDWFAAARTATKDNTESLQGFHSKTSVLRVIEEGSGVSDSAFEVLDGATGQLETKSITVGNPTRRDGQFYRIFNQDAEFYKQLTMPVLGSTIAPADYAPRMARKYGADSNIYRVRVLGEFPTSDEDSYIPLWLAEAARDRDILPQTNYDKVMGIDVARSLERDRTVFALRQGDQFLPYKVLRTKDLMKVVRLACELANLHKPKSIFIDVIGAGAGVHDRMRELGYPVIAVNVAETISMEFPEQYVRLRDELWGKYRLWLESGRGKIWDNADGDLVGESTSVKYKFTETGKIKIESKDELRARLPGLGSPDIADSHIMTFAMPISEYNRDLTTEEQTDDSHRFAPVDPIAGY